MLEDLEGRTLVVYDGECAFCRRSIAAIQARDRHNQFVYVPRNTSGLEERYPQLTLEDFDSGIRVIGQDGTVHVGADGIHQIASGLPYFRRWAWLYHAPVVHGVTRRMYAWVAANRMKLSRTCEGNCEIEHATSHSPGSGTTGGADKPSARTTISVLIVVVIGLHLAADAGKALSGSTTAWVGDKSWPFLAYGMYRTSHGPGTIRTTKLRFIGVTKSGAEVEIGPELAGVEGRQGLSTHFLSPMVAGDALAVERLADRINVDREDPILAFHMDSEEFLISDSGVVRNTLPRMTYRVAR